LPSSSRSWVSSTRPSSLNSTLNPPSRVPSMSSLIPTDVRCLLTARSVPN
jgi:hypothetical protein